MRSSATSRCGILLSAALARGTWLGSQPHKTRSLVAPFVAVFPGACCFIGAGALGLSDGGCSAETEGAAGTSEFPGFPCTLCKTFSTTAAAASQRRFSFLPPSSASFSPSLSPFLRHPHSPPHF